MRKGLMATLALTLVLGFVGYTVAQQGGRHMTGQGQMGRQQMGPMGGQGMMGPGMGGPMMGCRAFRTVRQRC